MCNFFDIPRSLLCTSPYTKPKAYFITYKTKTILKVGGTMTVKSPVIYLDKLWTVFGATRQGQAVGFCAWMVAARNRHVSYPTYNVLTRWVLKGHKTRVQCGYGGYVHTTHLRVVSQPITANISVLGSQKITVWQYYIRQQEGIDFPKILETLQNSRR
jgi:hypothetical protein